MTTSSTASPRRADRSASHSALRPAPGARRQDGAVRRLRDAGAVSRRHPEGASAHARGSGPVRRLAYGADRAQRAVGVGSRTPLRALETLVPVDIVGLGAGRQRYALLHQRARRHSRRPDGRQSRRPSAARRQRRLQGGGRGASARRILPADCAIEPLPDRALLALQGPRAGSGAGARSRRDRRDALHGRARRADRRARTASSRAPAIPARTASRSASPPTRRRGTGAARC